MIEFLLVIPIVVGFALAINTIKKQEKKMADLIAQCEESDKRFIEKNNNIIDAVKKMITCKCGHHAQEHFDKAGCCSDDGCGNTCNCDEFEESET